MSELIFAGGRLHGRIAAGVGSLVLSNVLRKNAVTQAMWQAVPLALDWLVHEQGARVIVLEGDGGKDFSSGADISEFNDIRKDAASARAYEDLNIAAFAAIRTCPVPVIARIRGICFGGAMGLAAACDIRLADDSARFAVPAAKLGLAYPAEAVVDFVAGLGAQRTRQLLYTGTELSARAMFDCGFLLAVTSADRLVPDTLEIAGQIAANSPMSVAASKLAIRAVVEGDAELARAARQAGSATFDSRDYAEGRQAFLDRRPANFKGD